mgnify:FL=1
MLVEILNGYEKKGPMAAKDSKAFVTTNIINYFFGALNAIVAFSLFRSYNIDAPFTFALISLTHFSLTLYTNSHKGFWKRYCTLANASLFVILLGYAFEDVLLVQILFFILLTGISALLFGNRQKKSLVLWFSIPFLLLVFTSIATLIVGNYAATQLPLKVTLAALAVVAIVIGLGSTILKVRQIQSVLDALLKHSSKECQPAAYKRRH